MQIAHMHAMLCIMVLYIAPLTGCCSEALEHIREPANWS